LSIWFILWFVLSFALLYFLGWTVYILFRQKQAWKTYAAKNKLRYTQSKLMSSPEMSGVIQDYTVSFFTAEHEPPDARSARRMTAIEISLSSRLPFEGGLASSGMVWLMRAIGFGEEYIPAHENWDKNWIAASSSVNALQTFMTPARLQALVSLMKLKNASVIFLFREDVTLLRLDTPDPLDMPDKIDKLVKIMIKTAQALELAPGEETRLQTAMKQKARKMAAPQEAVSAPKVLELEEEKLKPASEEPGEAAQE
jgi:hypothetical protein